MTLSALFQSSEVLVRQRTEPLEVVLDFETRNKYDLCLPDGQRIGFAAEQGKGLLAALGRQFFGHWRSFDVHVFDMARNLWWVASHPFRWFFQRFEIRDARGIAVGAIQQRFGLLYRRFDVEGPSGEVWLSMAAPRWHFWTFPLFRQGQEVALIEKKWSGLLKEAFTDADNFRITFRAMLSEAERVLVLATALFIDLLYFESKDNR